MESAVARTNSKYADYKDSGEYWMGKIPENWEIKKLKHIFKEKKKVTNPKLTCGSISFGKVVYKDDEKIPESTKASYQEVLAGEYLVNPLNLNYDLISLRIGLSVIDVVVSSGYIVLKNKIDLDKSYFNYLLHRYDVAYMKLLGSGVRQTISFNHIANSLLAFPPILEQTAIAAFLDDKTAKIDQAIAQKEKLIELLKERKQILIQDLVTGKKVWNAAKNAWTEPERVKDSGVEWIGKIPEGWEVKRIKFLTSKIGSGVTPPGGGTTYLDEGGIPLLRSQNVHFGKIDFNDVARISEKTHNSMSNSKVKKGDVLLNITGGSIGRCHYIESDEPINVNQHVCIMRPKGIETRFLNSMMASEIGQSQIWFFQQGGGREGLNFQALKNFLIPYPPADEREKIIHFIEQTNNRIDQAVGKQRAQIEKLKEYKATLIESAVTGKIKVCL